MKKFYTLVFTIGTLFAFAQKNPQTLGFIENKGQIIDQKGKANPAVLFLLNTPGLNVQLKKNSFSYDVYESKKVPLTEEDKTIFERRGKLKEAGISQDYSRKYSFHRVDIDFVNSNSRVQLIAEGKSADFNNYYNVNHASAGVTNVHKYAKVTYRNLYDHIDVVFFIPNDTTKAVEYNFVVRPGGRVSDIQLKFNGAKTELKDKKIRMKLRFGEMEETLPLSWMEDDAAKNEITVGFKNIGKNIYGFESEVNASNNTIVIDPTPNRLWGSYYGGSGDELPNCIAFDSNNTVYISGTTTSLSNIATAGTHLSSITNAAGFIAKLTPSGQRIWGTYYFANVLYIKVDNSFNVYASGNTVNSTVIATPGSHQPIKNAYNDGYLIKLNSSGVREWATYYGGPDNDFGDVICFDRDSNVYLAGATSSRASIATPGSHQEINASTGSYQEAFIAKFTPAGVRLWGTYYGGTYADGFGTMYLGDDNFMYAIGITHSDNNISTPGTYQTTRTGGADVMIVKFNTNGQRIWSTYLGGESEDYVYAYELSGNLLYLSGRTMSQTNIGTAGTYSSTFIPLPDRAYESSCIIKFNIATQQKLWGTYFREQIASSGVNSLGEIYTTGTTKQDVGIATADAYMSVRGIYVKSYLSKFDTSGQRIWGTYYGGNLAEQASIVRVDGVNNVYLYGLTTSPAGIATSGVHQEFLGSNPDTYLAKFLDCHSSTSLATSNSPVCIGQTVQLSVAGGTSFSWTGPNGFTSNQQNPVIPFANVSHSGIYTCTLGGLSGCAGTASVTVTVADTNAPVPNVSTLPTINGDCNTVVNVIPTATDNCSGTITATTTSPLNYTIPGSYTIVWNYNDGNGNTATQNQTVVIAATPQAVMTPSQQFCIQANATLNNIIITGQNIKWYDAQTGGNLVPITTLLQNGITYFASQTINGCESTRVPVLVTIQNTPAPSGNTSQSFCSSQNATVNDLAVFGNTIQWYSSTTGTSALPATTLLANNTTYYASQTVNGCESVMRLSVLVSLINTLNANDYAETLCDDLNDGIEIIDLTTYNAHLISSTLNHGFTFYTSQSGAENQSAADGIPTFTAYPLNIGTALIFVRIDSPNGCHQIVELELTLVEKPHLNLSDSVAICEGNPVTLDAGAGFDNYLWSTGEMAQSILIGSAGNYSVTVTENHGAISCSSTKNFTVVNSATATITEVVTSDWTYNQNTITVLASAGNTNDLVYSLDGINYQSDNTFTGLLSGDYTVYVKNLCGVRTEDLYLLMYPNFFTPNGDLYNDLWKIKFSENEPDLRIRIFDRYGKLMKELDSSSAGWDGTYLGKPLPSNDYWFLVRRQNGKEYRGHFSLKR